MGEASKNFPLPIMMPPSMDDLPLSEEDNEYGEYISGEDEDMAFLPDDFFAEDDFDLECDFDENDPACQLCRNRLWPGFLFSEN